MAQEIDFINKSATQAAQDINTNFSQGGNSGVSDSIPAKVCVMGDSISTVTQGRWPFIMGQFFDFEELTFKGAGGAEWRPYRSTKSSPFQQMQTLLSAISGGTSGIPDCIIIHCGTNDFGSGDSSTQYVIGSAEDTFKFAKYNNNGVEGADYYKDVDWANVPANASGIWGKTVCDGIRATCELLWASYPWVKVIISLPFWRSSGSNVRSAAAQVMMENLRTEMIQCADKLGCLVFDASKECGIGLWDVTDDMGDGLHPNFFGAVQIADAMGNYLKTIYHETPNARRYKVTFSFTHANDATLTVSAYFNNDWSTIKTMTPEGNTSVLWLPNYRYKVSYNGDSAEFTVDGENINVAIES